MSDTDGIWISRKDHEAEVRTTFEVAYDRYMPEITALRTQLDEAVQLLGLERGLHREIASWGESDCHGCQRGWPCPSVERIDAFLSAAALNKEGK